MRAALITYLSRPRLAAALVFSLSASIVIAFRFALPSSYAINESSDHQTHYWPTALKLARGRGYTLDDGSPATRYPPGHPLVLAAGVLIAQSVGVPIETVNIAVPTVSHALAALLIFLIANSVWGLRGAWFAALGWATYPFSLWLAKQPNSEGPFFVAFFATFAVFLYGIQRRSAVIPFFTAGLLAGVASLIRPIALGVSVVLALAVYLIMRDISRPRRLVCAALLIGGNLVAVAPWEGWVYAETHQIILLSTGGLASTMDGLTFPHSGSDRLPMRTPQDIWAYTGELRERASGFHSLGDVIAAVFKDIRQRPIVVGKLMAWKVVRSWYATDTRRHEIAIACIQLVYLVMAGFAGRRAFRGDRQSRALAISVLLLVGYFWAMTVSVLSIVRYMVPAMGLLFLIFPAILRPRVSAARMN